MTNDALLAAEVRATIRARNLRSAYIPGAAFSDPTWDMLLYAFAKALEFRRITLTALEDASNAPRTTAYIRILKLCDAGVLERYSVDGSLRRPIRLTTKGMAAMRAYFTAAANSTAILKAA